MVNYSPKIIAEALYETTSSASKKDVTPILDNVVAFLAHHRMLRKANEVVAHFERIANRHNKRIMAVVHTRSHLSESITGEITSMITKRYPGYSVTIHETIDPTVIGGVRIVIDDLVIDYSIQDKITQLRHHIMS